MEDVDGPYGHCDTCGAPCDDQGCSADRTHAAALTVEESILAGSADGDVVDETGANATASLLLNVHHRVVGDRDDDGHLDNCERCGFATGWLQPTSLSTDVWGHTTQATSTEVLAWIEAAS